MCKKLNDCDIYRELQRTKSELRLQCSEENWSPDVQRAINGKYKSVMQRYHRSSSPDVFPKYSDRRSQSRNLLSEYISNVFSTSIEIASASNPFGLMLFIQKKAWDIYVESYDKLQEGKSNIRLRACEVNVSDEDKHKANVQYKETWPFLHRPESPDVFPGY